MAYKYGIDFGTTNSSIALHFSGDDDEQHTYVVEMRKTLPKVVLPSLFFVDDGKIWVGDEAEEKSGAKGENISKNQFIKKIKLDLEAQGQNLVYDLDGRKVKGVDLIAELLKKLRLEAEVHAKDLELDMDGVVMGVPVEYDQIAKNVLIEALYKAGFYTSLSEACKKTEFVSEPIAVAIHYGLDLKKDMTVLVFDFGGGTLDLALVNLKENLGENILHPHTTIAKVRDTIGGEELNKLFFINSFCKPNKYGKEKIARAFGLSSSLSEIELWEGLLKKSQGIKFIREIERCKCDLSKRSHCKFSFIGRNVVLNEKTFYRDDFVMAIDEILRKIKMLINKCLEQGNITDPYEIDRVILAGGSSLIPAVQDILADEFGYNHVQVKDDENDEFVKKYASSSLDSEVLTSIVRGLAMVGYKNNQLVEDVVDCDYGLWDDAKQIFLPIIEKGIPVKETRFNKLAQQGKYRLVQCIDMNPSTVEVKVFQNNLNGYHKLGTISIPHPGGKKYKIYMTIDEENGMLEVVLYDVVRHSWIEDIPLNERRYELK